MKRIIRLFTLNFFDSIFCALYISHPCLFDKLFIAGSQLMDKTSLPHTTRFMKVLMQWDCKKTFLGVSMLMVGIKGLK